MPLRKPRWRHPDLQPGWIDRPHQVLTLGELPLESRCCYAFGTS
jgi:hypothetical protein